MELTANYLGLKIKSPIIAGSCAITGELDSMLRLEDAGIGAIVIKSIFEEEIIFDIKRNTHIVAPVENYGESYNYVAARQAADKLEKHFELIQQAKSRLSVPIVGSINCYSHESWITYARKFEEAGCDALELNIDILPYETSLSCDDVERTYGDVIRTLRKVTSLPLAIKVSHQFTDMAKFMQQLSWMGIHGITMFNRSTTLDIDLEKEEMCNPTLLSSHGDLVDTLRWVTILSNKLRCDISASSGVDSADDIIKLILAGAGTVQTVSSLYRNGIDHIKDLNAGLLQWMERKGYQSIADFKGHLALKSNDTASTLMRIQYMEHFAGIK